jgi:hypothetical protein
MTAAEINTTLKGFLDAKGRLTAFPAKRKKKLYALAYLAAFVEPEKRYTERQINELLCLHTVFRDPATLRRELYDNHFLNREANGSAYWLENPDPEA